MSENLEQNESQNLQNEEQNFDENINFDALKDDSSTKIIELEQQLSELTDKYYRANADFENIKKRFEKEKTDMASYANEKFARDLLPVIDVLEMAVKFEDSGNEFSQKMKEGVVLTIAEFKKALEKHGVTEVDTSGEFDPNVHNAVMKTDSQDYQSGQIVEVMQKGYMINGRVLRPAMVSIAN